MDVRLVHLLILMLAPAADQRLDLLLQLLHLLPSPMMMPRGGENPLDLVASTFDLDLGDASDCTFPWWTTNLKILDQQLQVLLQGRPAGSAAHRRAGARTRSD